MATAAGRGTGLPGEVASPGLRGPASRPPPASSPPRRHHISGRLSLRCHTARHELQRHADDVNRGDGRQDRSTEATEGTRQFPDGDEAYVRVGRD